MMLFNGSIDLQQPHILGNLGGRGDPILILLNLKECGIQFANHIRFLRIGSGLTMQMKHIINFLKLHFLPVLQTGGLSLNIIYFFLHLL